MMDDYVHGTCECTLVSVHNSRHINCPCSVTLGPASYSVVRDGAQIFICSRCVVWNDINRECLITLDEDFKVYLDYDNLGSVIIAAYLDDADGFR